MFISKKLRKVILLSAFAVMFSTVALSQTSSATALATQPFTDVIRPVQNITLEIADGASYTDSLDIVRLKDLKKVGVRDLLVSFLQFDISKYNKKNVIVNSAYLSLFGSGNGIVNLYSVANNWVSSASQASINNLRNNNKPIVSRLISDETNYFNDYNLIDAADQPEEDDQYISFVLLGDQTTNATFTSYAASDPVGTINGPSIAVTGEVPVPEPSSMTLGIMGLASMLGFKRKKA